MHGGPGLGCSEKDKQFFDPEKFYVAFVDQRGCGKSIPLGGLAHNQTADLILDLKRVVDKLKWDSVVLFGGSWGATLAILFAAAYPAYVNRLILRGFFSAARQTMDIYLQGKLQKTHIIHWERLVSNIPCRDHEVASYIFDQIHNRRKGYQKLGRVWARYGLALSRKHLTEAEIDEILQSQPPNFDQISVALHYALHSFFIPENHVFQEANKIKEIPAVIIHGLHDHLCPYQDAERLAEILSNTKLILVNGGHVSSEPEINQALLKALNEI